MAAEDKMPVETKDFILLTGKDGSDIWINMARVDWMNVPMGASWTTIFFGGGRAVDVKELPAAIVQRLAKNP